MKDGTTCWGLLLVSMWHISFFKKRKSTSDFVDCQRYNLIDDSKLKVSLFILAAKAAVNFMHDQYKELIERF